MAVVPSKRAWDEILGNEVGRSLEGDSLPSFLLRQRWFAGKARSIKSVRILDKTLGSDLPDTCCLALLEVNYTSGSADIYLLPLGLATGTEADRIDRETPGRVIARVAKVGLIYDATADPAFGRALLNLIAGNRSIPAGHGAIRGSSTSAFASARGSTKDALAVSGGSFEQSNSAIIFGDRLIMKVFRRLDRGINPDFEIGRFLSENTPFKQIPTTAGALLYEQSGSEPLMLGILQGLVPNQGSGWDHALRELKLYYERVVGQASPASPESRPLLELAQLEIPDEIRPLIGKYLDDSATLGRRTAELHLSLASRREIPAFVPEPIKTIDLEHLATEIRGQVEKALSALETSVDQLPLAIQGQARLVLDQAPSLLKRVDALSTLDVQATKIRVHGDYHLGQVLRTKDDFVILDFEGEPAKPLAVRVQKVSPLKDVVGMVRSFDYAAFAALFAAVKDRPELFETLLPWAKSWRTWVSASFLKAYFTTARASSFLPSDPSHVAALFDALTLDKALYELLYELNNRPDWIRIPLEGVAGLLEPALPVEIETLGDMDIYLLNEGTHDRAYEKLGAHLTTLQGVAGCRFAVWAPNALNVSVIGSFNDWTAQANPLQVRGSSGVWEGFVPGIKTGAAYKYAIESRYGDYKVEKADPYAFAAEARPQTASVVCDLSAYSWGDHAWMKSRSGANSLGAPISIYEVHLGSWMRGEGNRWLTYPELAPKLADYVHDMGFTHVEFMPVAEHPFDGSWGYQVTGYFAPTSRFGTPIDFMAMVDLLHAREIGVIVDWVPAHFPTDEHALGYFDGTHLYEHSDPRQGFHPDWNTFIFNFGRPEVANFLVANTLFWFDKYHIDGLRVDAVASMLYRDYSRKAGEWIPNQYGGRENLEAITLLKRVNERVHAEFPDVLMIAEESTSWPKVTRPIFDGGLGFDLKWDMGWMHDTLSYFEKDPVYRKHHHNQLTFRGLYAYSENFVMPLSHDEVVYGKGSLVGKMPGDPWRQFAGVRLLFGYQFVQPGKKMMFMGDEFGQIKEWNHDSALDWELLKEPLHSGLQRWVRDLNTLYRGCPELHELDHQPTGFTWVDANDSEQSVLSLTRQGHSTGGMILCVANFTPIPRTNYRVGVPRPGHWVEILNSDAAIYGGSGQGNIGGAETTPVQAHGHEHSLNLTLPPLAIVAFRAPAL